MRNVAGLATAYPRSSPWQTLASEGFESIVCLTDDKTRYDPRPLKILRASRFKELLRRSASRVAGTGRTGTVIACTLRALGLSVPDVLDYMTRLNVARDRRTGWPESEWQLQQVTRWLPS